MFQFIVNRIFAGRILSRGIRPARNNSGSGDAGRGAPRKSSVPRLSLYCVWIPAHEGENGPLIRVWIDPSMSMFDSQAHVHQPDLAAARAEVEAALIVKGDL